MGIGYGRPGDVAHVWLLVENVGNAQETTEMQWSSNSWSSDTTIVDYSGNTQWSIELDPSAKEEYLIEFEVPSTKGLGDSTFATLTLCIGSGDEEICEDFTVTVFASNVSTDVPHIRTVPTTGLSWDIDSNYVGTTMQWDMSSCGMLKEGWLWSASGDLAINGTMLEMTGQNGHLHLDLPLDAPPMRHHFNQSEAIVANSDLSISLHVLQVYRAEAEVVTPADGAVFNVSERTKIILKLENPGNGEDTFTLVGSTNAGNLSQAPEVLFEISNPTRTIGAGGLTMVPVWVTLPEDVPARETFEIVFDWTSTGDTSVSDQANITIEARPDHRWDIEIGQGSLEQVAPGDVLSLNIDITNIGNTDDLLTLTPSFAVSYSGNDTSTWQADSINSSRLQVMETESLIVNVTIPENTWAGTIANLTLIASSSGFDIGNDTSIELEVENVAGWRLDLTDTSLEVAPGGGELQILVEQKGNAPAMPYFAKAGQGWNVTLPNNGPIVEPGDTGMITINVTPPEDAVAGEVGIISIRISNGNGAGQIVEQVPVRVGTAPGITLDSSGGWMVRQDVSSWPTSWIENTGNDVAIMQLSVPNLPSGWVLVSEDVVVVAPGEIKGMPLQLQPASDWNENNFQLDIHLEHPTLGTLVHAITVTQSDTVLTSSPVHTGRSGEKVSITTDSSSDGVETSLVPLPEIRSNTTHNGMTLHLVGIPAPIHEADCENAFGSLTSLGIEDVSTLWTSCLLTANSEHPLVANAWLRTSDGEMLDSRTIRLSPGDNMTVNLSALSWDPEPGLLSVEVLIVDSNGLSLYSSTSEHIARQSGWNLKISNFEIDEDYINVGIDREGYEIMEGSICQVDIVKTDGKWQKSVAVDIYGSKYAPSIQIDRPDKIDDDAEVTATISCLAPWDVDDDSTDNSMKVYADNLPLVTYESSDLYWTGGIALILIVLAYFGGVLNLNRPEDKVVKKEEPVIREEVVEETKPDEEIVIDDMSLGEEPFEEELPDEEVEIEPEEEVIDIDDSSASGRLSALRREIKTDLDPVSEPEDDISSRLDAFLKDR